MTTTQKKTKDPEVKAEQEVKAADKPTEKAPAAKAPEPVQAAAQPAKPQPKLQPNRLELAEFRIQQFRVVPQTGVTLEQVLDKTFFTHCANKLKAGNQLHVQAEDGSFYAWLLVRAVSGSEVTTEVLVAKTFVAIDQGTIHFGNYVIVNTGLIDKHCVFRKSDNYKLSSGHETDVLALAWLTEHQKALAA
jgi:hypothetical protein